MGAEFLVASLWVAVFAYWLWTRRPTSGDTIGLFRYELRVLEFASPNRVAPANRLYSHAPLGPEAAVQAAGRAGSRVATSLNPSTRAPALGTGALASPAPLSEPLAAAVGSYRRSELRRRRRDVLCVLACSVLVTLAAAVVARSAVAIGAQVLCDLALIAYLGLLVRTTKSRLARLVPAARFVDLGPDWAPAYPRRPYPPEEGRLEQGRPLFVDTALYEADPAIWLREAEPHRAPQAPAADDEHVGRGENGERWEHAERWEDAEGWENAERWEHVGRGEEPEHVPLHAGRRGGVAARYWAMASAPAESYGDFDSYASLAL